MMQDSLMLSQRNYYKDYDNPYELSPEEIRLACDSFYYAMLKDMIDNAVSITLPYGLGIIGVFRVAVHGKGVFDYQLYKETGIKRYHRNNNSGQEVAVFRWIRSFPYYRSPFKYKIFNFKPTRYWKRYLAAKMKGDDTILKYYYYDN